MSYDNTGNLRTERLSLTDRTVEYSNWDTATLENLEIVDGVVQLVPSGPVIPDGAIAQWTFDETAADQIGTYDGTLENGAAYSTDAQLGSSVELGGSGDHVSFASLPSLFDGSSSWSISHWIKVADGFSSNAKLFHPRAQADLGTEYRSEGAFAMNWWNPDADERITASISTGQWVHTVGVWDNSAGEIRIYVNGTREATGTDGSPYTDVSSTNALGIRPDNNNLAYEGLIDEVFLFDRALSDSEVSDFYGSY